MSDAHTSPAPTTARDATATLALDVHLGPDDLRAVMREEVLAGLTATPRTVPPKYFYDARGSELFVDITRLPEYYPTRTEATILRDHASDIVERAGADVLVELGSGASEKTRLLLDAMGSSLRRYIPFDVSADALREAMDALAGDYPDLDQHGVVGDFDRHLGEIPAGGRRLVAFLGSTIGNLHPTERHEFLTRLRAGLIPGDSLLLGADLIKDSGRLIAAYDDAAGVTAEFNRNVLHVLNRDLGGDFDVDAYDHHALWDPELERIEMRLRASRPMQVTLSALDLSLDIAAGEEIRTEISTKFQIDGVTRELKHAGFTPAGTWTDLDGDFALCLAQVV